MKKPTKSKVVDKLLGKAMTWSPLLSSRFRPLWPTERRRLGIEIKDHQLPGRLIESLTAEEREIVKDLKTEDFNHRDDAVVFVGEESEPR